MVPQNVRDELTSPFVIAGVVVILASAGYWIAIRQLVLVVPVVSIVVTAYLVYLFIRLVLAVEEIASEP